VCWTGALVAARVLRHGNADADTHGNGDDDEQDDEGAPPLELAAAAGVVCGGLDLLVALVEVLDGLLGVLLGGHDDSVLLLDDGGQLLVKDGQLTDGLLDALQLVVAGANVAEDRAGMASAVGSELCQSQRLGRDVWSQCAAGTRIGGGRS
jgi:hypothetical protein